jgi:hypothetical protein
MPGFMPGVHRFLQNKRVVSALEAPTTARKAPSPHRNAEKALAMAQV